MPVTQELLAQINDYEKKGYSPAEITAGLKQSPKYKDIADQITAYEGQQETPDRILAGIKASPTASSAATPDTSRWKQIGERIGGDIKEATGNILPSAGRFAANIGTALTRPQQTVETMGNIAAGGVERGMDVITGKKEGAGEEEPVFDAFIKAITDRYGGWDKLERTMVTDPVGFLADVSTLLSGGATIAESAGLEGIAAVAKTGASFTNPISLATKGIAAGANKIAQTGLPESIYARTMKIPPGSLRDTERANVLKTLVRDEKLPLGKGAVDRMSSTIKTLDNGISTAIENASQKGETVEVSKLVKALDNMKNSKEIRRRLDAPAAVKAIDKTKQNILDHSFNQSGQLSLSDAHNLKKGIYEEIQAYYLKQQKPETGRIGVRNEMDARAMAETAKTLRQEVLNNSEIPDSIRKDMQREAGLMNARKWVERATNRGGNLDPVGLSGMLFGVLVDGGIPGAAAWRIATSQPVMSRLAIALGKSSRTGISTTKPIVLYQAGRATGLSNQKGLENETE